MQCSFTLKSEFNRSKTSSVCTLKVWSGLFSPGIPLKLIEQHWKSTTFTLCPSVCFNWTKSDLHSLASYFNAYVDCFHSQQQYRSLEKVSVLIPTYLRKQTCEWVKSWIGHLISQFHFGIALFSRDEVFVKDLSGKYNLQYPS